MDRREMKRPPAMGEMKRIADAQAPTLRAELRAVMRLDGLTAEEVARLTGLDVATLAAFLEGASINPRWQEKLAKWLERAGEDGRPSGPAAPPQGDQPMKRSNQSPMAG